MKLKTSNRNTKTIIEPIVGEQVKWQLKRKQDLLLALKANPTRETQKNELKPKPKYSKKKLKQHVFKSSQFLAANRHQFKQYISI